MSRVEWVFLSSVGSSFLPSRGCTTWQLKAPLFRQITGRVARLGRQRWRAGLSVFWD